MKYYAVIFDGTPYHEYVFKSCLELPLGAKGRIIADGKTTYDNQVKIARKLNAQECQVFEKSKSLRVITNFQMTCGVPKPKDRIKNVYFNKEKGTTCVLWDDGTKTIVKCAPEDTWDEEKALALCYMKRLLGNRGSFNETLKKYCNI